MSHSPGLLPLDPVSWLEVLIRAGGTEGAKDAGRTSEWEEKERKGGVGGWKKSLIHQPAAVPPHVFISPSSNRCLKCIPLSCFTQERRSARLYLASIT